MNQDPKISVIIPCLESNAIIRNNLDILKEDSRVTEVILIKDIGIGKARDNGIKKAKSDLILWFDSDIELISNPINDFLEVLNRNEKTVGVAATVRIKKADWQTHLLSVATEVIYEHCVPFERNSVTRLFDCSLFRKNPLLEVGFDRMFSYSAEDADIYQKLKSRGYRVITTQKVIVCHHKTMSSWFNSSSKYKTGTRQFVSKYGFNPNRELQEYRPSPIKLFLISIKLLLLRDKKIRLCLAFPFFISYVWLVDSSALFGDTYKKLKSLSKYPLYYLQMKISPEYVRPKTASFLVTENCLFKCKTCSFWKKRADDPGFDQAKEIIEKCKNFGIDNMILLGGEPLLRSDLVKISQEIKRNNIRAGLITNGYIHDEDILNFDWDGIAVSIDGFNFSTHDEIRGVDGSWRRAIKTIGEFEKRNKYPHIHFVIQKKNYTEFSKMLRFCETNNLKLVPYFCNIGGLGQTMDTANTHLRLDKFSEIIKPLKRSMSIRYISYFYYLSGIIKKLKNGQRANKCFQPYMGLTIRSNGDVHPCPNFPNPIGNMLKNDLETIWENSKTLRTEIRQGRCNFCEKCTSICLVENQAFNLSSYLRVFVLFVYNNLRAYNSQKNDY